MSARNAKELAAILSRTGRFRHVWCEREIVFVVQDIDALTGVCTPVMRRRDGEAHIQYDMNVVVASARGQDDFGELQGKLVRGEYLGLPRSTGVAHTLDTFVKEGRVTDWLVDQVIADVDRYTLGANEAVEFILTGGDRMIENLKRLLPDAFRDIIELPLLKLRAAN